jgi:hypothetical protein
MAIVDGWYEVMSVLQLMATVCLLLHVAFEGESETVTELHLKTMSIKFSHLCIAKCSLSVAH